MLRLASTSQSLQIVLGAAPGGPQPQCIASFFDQTQTGETTKGGTTTTATLSTTSVTLVSAPQQDYVRNIDTLSCYNANTTVVAVTVKLVDSATSMPFVTQTLSTSQTLFYENASGWAVI